MVITNTKKEIKVGKKEKRRIEKTKKKELGIMGKHNSKTKTRKLIMGYLLIRVVY